MIREVVEALSDTGHVEGHFADISGKGFSGVEYGCLRDLVCAITLVSVDNPRLAAKMRNESWHTESQDGGYFTS